MVLVSCRRDIVDDDDRVIHPHRGWKGAPAIADAAYVARSTVRAGTNVIGEPSAVLLRTAVLREAGGFAPDQAYMIDLDAWMRVLEHGRLAYLQATLCTFRVSSTSWSAHLARQQAGQGRALLRSIRDRYPGAVSETDLRTGFARRRARRTRVGSCSPPAVCCPSGPAGARPSTPPNRPIRPRLPATRQPTSRRASARRSRTPSAPSRSSSSAAHGRRSKNRKRSSGLTSGSSPRRSRSSSSISAPFSG